MTTIAIVGAGFSGSLLALHLLRQCSASTRVVLIERNKRFGPGAAYSTGNSSHLLNVPAARMSAFHDQPRDFLEWLQRSDGDVLPADRPVEETFVPRQLYGAYIRQLIMNEMRKPGNGGRLKLVRGDVLAVDEGDDHLLLRLDRARHVEADLMVLATGNFPPEAPPGIPADVLDSPLYHPDPWAPGALTALDPQAPVLLIGTGLTMVDTVVSLLDRGHRGPIYALSRRGLLPHRHAPGAAARMLRRRSFPTQLNTLARFLRTEASRAVAEGAGWQPIVDELRPFIQDVWLAFSPEDRARFLRHLRPWWEVHRHRMAPKVADRIDGVRAAGQLQVHAGRIQDARIGDGTVTLDYRQRCTGWPLSLAATRIVNCSGPSCDYDRIAHPLIRDMLTRGLVRPDVLKLGLDVTANCAVKHADGAISRRVFAIGPATKGTFWEMTAVPDIRRQCEFLASQLRGLAGDKPASQSHEAVV